MSDTVQHNDGRFSIAARLLLNEAQRDRLLVLCRQEALDVSDLITRIVGAYLDERDDLPSVDRTPPPVSEDEQRQTRRILRQLRAQAGRLGDNAPDWLRAYIADLEASLRP
jgi:hypothetical protein